MKRLVFFLSSLLTFVALANVAGACGALGYQPEVPSKLLK
ncbi:MAG: cyclic lactone autoinducer peptide [Dehalobacterium sp.]